MLFLIKNLFLYFTETYDECRPKLKKAEDTSNLDTDDSEEQKKNRRVKARKTFDDYIVDQTEETSCKRQKVNAKKYTKTVDAALPMVPPCMMSKGTLCSELENDFDSEMIQKLFLLFQFRNVCL